MQNPRLPPNAGYPPEVEHDVDRALFPQDLESVRRQTAQNLDPYARGRGVGGGGASQCEDRD